MSRPGDPRYRLPHTKPSASASVLTRKFFEALTEKRVNITTAAEDAGLNRITLQYWKSGGHKADVIVIEHLCRLYGITICIP